MWKSVRKGKINVFLKKIYYALFWKYITLLCPRSDSWVQCFTFLKVLIFRKGHGFQSALKNIVVSGCFARTDRTTHSSSTFLSVFVSGSTKINDHNHAEVPPPQHRAYLLIMFSYLMSREQTRPQRTPTGKTNRSYLRVISRYICRLCVPLTDLFIDRRGGDLLGLRASRWRAVNVSTRFSVFCGPWCSKFRQDAYLFNYLFFPRRILQSSVGEQRSTKRTN